MGDGIESTGVRLCPTDAINDALAPFSARVTAQPFTPERVLRALRKVP
jgi:hypothetical protein